MPNLFMPKKAVNSISDIDVSDLVNQGIKGVILDIDNTLESHKVPEPQEKTMCFLKELEKNGLKICLISNGRHERVERFNKNLGYFTMAKAGKPKKTGYLAAQKMMELSPEEIAMVGDQLFTDVFGANRCKMYSVLVEPIEQIENAFFYIKRFFEKPIRRAIKKKNL